MALVSFDRGIDGSVSGGINGRIFRWALVGQQVVVDVSGFGDGGASRFREGKRVFLVSCNGHSVPGTAGIAAIKAMGTAHVQLFKGTVTAYEGDVLYQSASDGADYKGGDSPIAFAGVFDGDPT